MAHARGLRGTETIAFARLQSEGIVRKYCIKSVVTLPLHKVLGHTETKVPRGKVGKRPHMRLYGALASWDGSSLERVSATFESRNKLEISGATHFGSVKVQVNSIQVPIPLVGVLTN